MGSVLDGTCAHINMCSCWFLNSIEGEKNQKSNKDPVDDHAPAFGLCRNLCDAEKEGNLFSAFNNSIFMHQMLLF